MATIDAAARPEKYRNDLLLLAELHLDRKLHGRGA
jgi:hypothetical protein